MRSGIPRPEEPIVDLKTGRLHLKTWYRWLSFFSQDAAATENEVGSTPRAADAVIVGAQLDALSHQSSALQTQVYSRLAQLESAILNLELQPQANIGFLLSEIIALQNAEDHIYAPLVNGDLPGPTPIANPLGEFIMVRVA